MISIIIPVYNVEQYIDKCIHSILNQTYGNFEIIIIDDGSTDSSGQRCDEYASKDSRIKVIHRENKGIVSARKEGLIYSVGEYVTYVDGDDWIDNAAYENMISDIEKNDSDIVIYAHYESIGNINKPIYHNILKGKHNKASLVDNIYPNMIAGDDFFEWRMFTSVCDKLFRREILLKALINEDERITIGEDIACVIPAMFEADSVFISDKCFYHYRQSTNSMVKKVSDIITERERYSVLYRYVKDILVKYGYSNIVKQWIDLLLFIMIPRSDQLYDGFEDAEYIFPFKNIRRGSRIALYCAGTYGQRLYNYINSSGSAEIVVWVDQNYNELQKMGLAVNNPEELINYEFDGIIVATMFDHSRKAIYKYLSSLNLGVPIGIVNEDYVRSEEVISGFRLT